MQNYVLSKMSMILQYDIPVFIFCPQNRSQTLTCKFFIFRYSKSTYIVLRHHLLPGTDILHTLDFKHARFAKFDLHLYTKKNEYVRD